MKTLLHPGLWSLRLRMILLSLASILSACLLLTLIAANALYSILLTVGQREADLIAYRMASQISSRLNNGMVAMLTLADYHAAIEPGSTISLPRKAATAMLGTLLERNPQFIGMYSIWETQQFDLLDNSLAGQPGQQPDGRLLISWVRDETGQPLLDEDPNADYETPGQGDY